MDTVLICDDDQAILESLEIYLHLEGYEVVKATNGEEALAAARANEIHCIILDIMMPGLDGLNATLQLREFHNVPIILLSAKSEDTDKITGLSFGADDYVTKPFLPLELVARVKAQLRRYKQYNTGVQPDEDVIEYSGLVINAKTRECTLNEKPLSLTPTEFAILKILCQKRGSVVSAEELFHGVWGEEYYTKNNNTITVHIRHLREKMGDSFESPKYIKTVWGVGYKIEG